MLAASFRLRRGRDIGRVSTRGRYTGGGSLGIKALRTGSVTSRAVVVVSKKVSKRATVRNRIRRRLAAALAAEWATVVSGYDIVITVREDVAETPPATLTKQLQQPLSRAGLHT